AIPRSNWSPESRGSEAAKSLTENGFRVPRGTGLQLMQSTIQPQQEMKTKDKTTLHLIKTIGLTTAGRGFLPIPLPLASFAFPRAAQAEDGGYPNGNTAESESA